jgi:hypothetical protein
MTANDERDPHAVAIGAYLRRRARLEGVTAEQAAAAIGKGTATVQRVYAGTIETGLIGGLRLFALVRGSYEHIRAILDDVAPTVERAIELAELPPGTPGRHDPVMAVARLLAQHAEDDPGLVDAVEGFLAGRRSARRR